MPRWVGNQTHKIDGCRRSSNLLDLEIERVYYYAAGACEEHSRVKVSEAVPWNSFLWTQYSSFLKFKCWLREEAPE